MGTMERCSSELQLPPKTDITLLLNLHAFSPSLIKLMYNVLTTFALNLSATAYVASLQPRRATFYNNLKTMR